MCIWRQANTEAASGANQESNKGRDRHMRSKFFAAVSGLIVLMESLMIPIQAKASCWDVACGNWSCKDAYLKCECPGLWPWICQWNDFPHVWCQRPCYDASTGEFCYYEIRQCSPGTCPALDAGMVCAWKRPWDPCPTQYQDTACLDSYCRLCPP